MQDICTSEHPMSTFKQATGTVLKIGKVTKALRFYQELIPKLQRPSNQDPIFTQLSSPTQTRKIISRFLPKEPMRKASGIKNSRKPERRTKNGGDVMTSNTCLKIYNEENRESS